MMMMMMIIIIITINAKIVILGTCSIVKTF